MSAKALKFTVLFMCNASDVAEFVSNTKAFFNDCSSEKFTHVTKLADVRKHDNEFGYNNELYDLEISIICSDVKRDSDIENFIFAIKKKWCSEAKKNEYLMWLMFENQSDISTNFTNYYDNIKASEFAFGTVPTMKIFVPRYRFRVVRTSCVLCSFSHLQRHFAVYISSSHNPACKKNGEMGYKLIVEYINIIRIIANFDSEQNTADLYFHLEYPPLMYINQEQSHDEDSELQLQRISKAKLMEYTSKKFERTFEFGCQCNYTFCKTKGIGRTLVLKMSFEDKFQTRWIIEQLSVRCYKKTKIYFTSLTTEKINEKLEKLRRYPWTRNAVVKNISSLIKFDCEYAWKTIHTKTTVVLNEIALKQKYNQNYIDHLAQELSSYAFKNSSALVKALFCIADMANKGLIFTFEKALAFKFKYFCDVKELRELPRGMCYIRRVLITPSRTIFLQPFEHFDNRVIRQFGVEYILRVSVQDDNYSKLTYAVHHNSQKESIMEEVVKSKLKNGLVIGFRHYEILASSSSQLREHGLWMYAKDQNGNTAASIRKWMGDFSSIKNVAKYMARMGQCFSSTEEGVQITIKNEEEVHLEDIKTWNGRYTFSDGIGTISTALADEVRLALIKHTGATKHENNYKPSAFQIRYKGCKGMIAEIPDICGRSIGIRPSMIKFECYTSDQLEIVKTSGPRRLYLNKHLITILEQMGVPKENFLDLQIDVMLDMLNSLIDENVALSHLAYNMDVFFPFGALLDAGISFTAEPFFRSLLLAFLKSYAGRKIIDTTASVSKENHCPDDFFLQSLEVKNLTFLRQKLQLMFLRQTRLS
ncbi:uncharacterized protein LOC118198167 [Stegodyphus dumicola]|uniref:uncharacterized protein LOC118198167 n=1 Tax=Stegodyphus dumicola TaxID=202533 RepID=UPI0015A972E1|nr:uncharacterized protein LOC118198167 [Stegodyphus dumicola]XP_035225676.1 uncharacterized protein LOC118198167 [Stegodyphus dumicola]